jgi:hypothetical protein
MRCKSARQRQRCALMKSREPNRTAGSERGHRSRHPRKLLCDEGQTCGGRGVHGVAAVLVRSRPAACDAVRGPGFGSAGGRSATLGRSNDPTERAPHSARSGTARIRPPTQAARASVWPTVPTATPVPPSCGCYERCSSGASLEDRWLPAISAQAGAPDEPAQECAHDAA